MKKIGLSLGMIVFVGVVVIGATGAFFSDTETSTGNTFTAGAIDLKIDNESYYNGARNEGTSWEQSDLDGSQQFFNFRDLKPGDWGEDTISIHVNNNDAYACVDVRLDSNDDNGLTEPEAGDGDTTDGAGNGELADAVNFYWWADDGDNVYEDEETLLNGGTLGNLAVGEVATIALADTNGSIFGNTASNTNALIGDQVYYVGKAWCFGDSTFAPYAEGDTGPIDRPVICDGSNEDNTTQTDGLTATISFYAEQARNNSQFVCTPHLGDAPDPIVFQLTDQDGEHDDNQANGEPYVTWVINGDEIDFTFHNPTNIASPFPFEYRIDDEVGAPIDGITGVVIPSGPYATNVWGDFYNFENVGPNSSSTITLTGTSKIQVRLVIGPERDYDFEWITFEAI